MKKHHSDIIESTLKKINDEMSRHDSIMEKLRQELLSCAAYFESYGEMYIYIKSHTPSFAAFCIDMKDALPIFYAAEEARQKEKNNE